MADRSKFPRSLGRQPDRAARALRVPRHHIGSGSTWPPSGFSRDQLGIVQSLFSSSLPDPGRLGATFADRYGSTKVLIAAYLAYIPAILLLLARSPSRGSRQRAVHRLAAGIFKPLSRGDGPPQRPTPPTRRWARHLYAIVNVGRVVRPDRRRQAARDLWDYAFMSSADRGQPDVR